jgi:hypothetical protein
LEQRDLMPALQEAGFDPSRPAFFSWLGVVQYLTWPAIELTLRAVTALPTASTIVMSFMLPDTDLPTAEAAAARAVAEAAAAKGEPWLTRIQPADLAQSKCDSPAPQGAGGSKPRCYSTCVNAVVSVRERGAQGGGHCGRMICHLPSLRIQKWPASRV